MSERHTPEWYVTDYPEEGSFSVTDGYDIFAMICGGKAVGDECDLASRIAKLPDVERERDKWEETARLYCQNSDFHKEMREKAERERDEARKQVKELIYIASRAISLAEINVENDKFGIVSELRYELKQIMQEGAK